MAPDGRRGGGAKGKRGSLSAGHWARSTGGAKEGLGTREGVHLQAAGTRGVRQAGMLAGMQHCREETEKEEKRGARSKVCKVQGAAEGTGPSIMASSPPPPLVEKQGTCRNHLLMWTVRARVRPGSALTSDVSQGGRSRRCSPSCPEKDGEKSVRAFSPQGMSHGREEEEGRSAPEVTETRPAAQRPERERVEPNGGMNGSSEHRKSRQLLFACETPLPDDGRPSNARRPPRDE
jgi:hypothetical protein